MEDDGEGIESRIKNGILEIYEDLFQTVWAKIVPTLGTVTVVTIVQRAIDRTGRDHQVLTYLMVTDAGLSFDRIRERLGDEERTELREAFKDLIANLFDILAKLTGNIIVKQLIKEVDGLDVPMEENR